MKPLLIGLMVMLTLGLNACGTQANLGEEVNAQYSDQWFVLINRATNQCLRGNGYRGSPVYMAECDFNDGNFHWGFYRHGDQLMNRMAEYGSPYSFSSLYLQRKGNSLQLGNDNVKGWQATDYYYDPHYKLIQLYDKSACLSSEAGGSAQSCTFAYSNVWALEQINGTDYPFNAY